MMLIKTNGAKENFTDRTLEGQQKAVGGWIEIQKVRFKRSFRDDEPEWDYVIINEEGRLEGLPRNASASRRAGFEIVGNAIFAEAKEIN